jgi:hypothetical protein
MSEIRRRPRTFRRVYVDSADVLREVVEELSVESVLGVDLEMAQRVDRRPGGVQEWRHVLALIQIAGGELSVVIDPVRCTDRTPLRPLMAGPARKVFLGGGQDAGLLEKSGIPARNIVDVGEIALALYGRREDGMAALADRIFGISLDKTVRRADWLRRPLDPVLIAYAHRDAELTLQIYDWFHAHHPDNVRFHERVDFEPGLPSGASAWLQEVSSRHGQDPTAILMELGLDPVADGDTLSADLRAALQASVAPRQTNRLLRLASDLGLTGTAPDILPYVSSPSSMLRISAARAIARLGTAEAGVPALEPLLEDPIPEVQRAAEGAIRELQVPPSPAAQEVDPAEDAPTLAEGPLAALQRLKDQMQSGD